jgi:hypothetical protein
VCGSALAKDGTVRGTLTGIPQGSAFTAITAVNGRGEVGGIGNASPAGRYSLTLAPGTWLLAGATGSPYQPPAVTGADAFSVVRVRAGRSTTGKTLPVSATAAAASPAAALKLKPGSVVTVPFVGMEDFRPAAPNGTNYDFTSVAQNELFRLCSSHGIVFADTSPEFTKFARQESNLSASGRLATPFTYRPIKPQYTVGTVDQGLEQGYVEMGLNIRPTNSPDSFAVVHAQWGSVPESTSPNAPIPSDGDVVSTVQAAARKLAAKVC